eukprot:gene9033-16676_t
MAPKKKAAAKGDKKEDNDGGAEEKQPKGPTERELQMKGDRLENEWLQQEAQEVRIESHEYMSYMTKKTQKRQSAIVSLSDRNADEIKQTNNHKAQMLKNYDDQKAALQEEILAKEAELDSAKRDLESLKEYQVLQKEQESEIARLEKEVHDMRATHSDAVQKLKAKFIAEKCAFQKTSDEKINKLTKEANLEARQCLQDHTWRIKDENRALRKELLGLIQDTRVLYQHKKQLEEQHKILSREKQYADKLHDFRYERQEALYEGFGLKPEKHSSGNGV